MLLYLITKHKLDITDIPIIELVEQYTDFVKQLEDDDMEVASEFLEMAARLVYIKTVSLLPVYEEANELKAQLSAELIEYRDCKLLAQELAGKTQGFNYVWRLPEQIEPDLTYRRLHEPQELLAAYSAAAGRKLRRLPPPVEAFKGIVAKKIVSVSSRINVIVQKLKSGKKQKLKSFLNSAQSRSELVASFLAVLELAKNKTIFIDGSGEDADIELINTDFSGFEELGEA